MKTAIWLYLFMFVAIFDLHAQYPILSPFALSLGAAPSFIGLIMGAYSLTHLPGNLMAGYGIDRFGSRFFICLSLFLAGVVLLYQSRLTNPYGLLVARSVSGFVLAFLSPACLALLAKLARDRFHQGKLMAGNGVVHTLASVVSPAAGAFMVAKFGFAASFSLLGWVLMGTGLLALAGIRDIPTSEPPAAGIGAAAGKALSPLTKRAARAPVPWLIYGIPFALSCSQGILFFELPLMESSRRSIASSGILFSVVSLGALLTLGMLFLNRMSSFLRTTAGSLGMAVVFFGMAVSWPIPLLLSLFFIGAAHGVILPALSTLLAEQSEAGKYGRVFSMLSISFSAGAFFGPLLSGQLRDAVSPYYAAFLVIMLALILLPFPQIRYSARRRKDFPTFLGK